jgi:serine protease Do
MDKLDRFYTTRKGLTFLVLIITLGLGITIGTIVSDEVWSAEQEKVAQLNIQGEGTPVVLSEEVSLREGFARIANVIEPAVVNINTQSIIESGNAQNPHQSESFRQFFGDEFWERFFGGPEGGTQKRASLGSGVIVDSKGFILSNYHVVAPIETRNGRREADKIEVTLFSGDSYVASVVGTDPESDLAVLKINSDKPLPFAKVGNSYDLKVGDWVLAIGSPFGYEQTVTAGIVSATQRVVPLSTSFGDYIQTDAAINPGNSGGPLVNMKGEVVGINSFISTNTGTYVGVGFAIPSSVFVNSYNQIVTSGKIERGWLGISMNTFPMTPEMASYFGVAGSDSNGIKDGNGVVITQLINEKGEPGDYGPAAKAGIKPGDVIVKFNNRDIEEYWDLRMAVASTPPGETVPVVVVRDGEVLNLKIELAERTYEQQRRADNEDLSFEEKEEEEERPKEIGLDFKSLNTREAKQLGFADDQEGVLITGVTPGSLADDASLIPSMVITHVNGKKVVTGQDLMDEVTSLAPGKGVVLRILWMARDRTVSIGYTSFLKP